MACKYLTATEMREISEHAAQKQADVEIDHVMEDIGKAANDGRRCIVTAIEFKQKQRSWTLLEGLGYHIKDNGHDYTISW